MMLDDLKWIYVIDLNNFLAIPFVNIFHKNRIIT